MLFGLAILAAAATDAVDAEAVIPWTDPSGDSPPCSLVGVEGKLDPYGDAGGEGINEGSDPLVAVVVEGCG